MKYFSVCYASCNENSREEIVIENQRTFWQFIMRRGRTTDRFERLNQIWFDKETNAPVSRLTDLEKIKYCVDLNKLSSNLYRYDH